MRLAWLLLSIAPLAAAPVELSLKHAVQLAVSPEGNTRVRLSAEALKQAESRAVLARGALLPDLSAAFTDQNLTRNLAAMGIQITVPIPGFHIPTFVGPFTTMDARVSASQSVFDFSSIRRFQASKVGMSAAKADVTGSAEQVAAQVARTYLAAVRADADVEAAKANVTLSEAVLKQAENQKAAGAGTGIEITRARVQLANDRQRLLVVENARRAAGLQLLRGVGLRLDTELVLTDNLQYIPLDPLTLEQAKALALQGRPDLEAQQQRESTARLSASATKLERLPTVAAFGDYGSSGTGFDNSLPTRTIGISVRVPLFDGGRRDARRAESASQYRSEKVRTNDLKEQIELDVRLALDALRSAEEQVKVSREGLELAENELAQARRRYEAGVAIGVEVTDAQTRLERARDNQTTALYNYNVGRIDLAQAMGAVRKSVE
ncbi:MAG: TolC family protein [Candidatus Solibacter sp.]|nr:TolC family protein [Candidatus Solibacter sp.]